MTSTLPISAAFSEAVEASFAHMRSRGRTERNQDDFDAGVIVLVELSESTKAFYDDLRQTDGGF